MSARLSTALALRLMILGSLVVIPVLPADGFAAAARFEEVARCRFHLPYCPAGGSPWSPSGSLLAVDSAGTLALLDISKPREPLMRLFAKPPATNLAVSWSPDGRWIACRTKTYSSSPIREGTLITDSLWAIPVAGGPPILVWAGEEDGLFFWGSDGVLYSWQARRPSRFVLPGGPTTTSDALKRQPRLSEFSPEASRTRGVAARIVPGDPPGVTPLPALGRALICGSFPDERRFLVTRSEGRGPRTVVVDEEGTTLASLDVTAREDSSGTKLEYFSAGSVTSDGRYVAGFYEIDRDENVAKAAVFLIDVAATSPIPVAGAPYAIHVECSRTDHWLALETLDSWVVVGALEVRR